MCSAPAGGIWDAGHSTPFPWPLGLTVQKSVFLLDPPLCLHIRCGSLQLSPRRGTWPPRHKGLLNNCVEWAFRVLPRPSPIYTLLGPLRLCGLSPGEQGPPTQALEQDSTGCGRCSPRWKLRSLFLKYAEGVLLRAERQAPQRLMAEGGAVTLQPTGVAPGRAGGPPASPTHRLDIWGHLLS